MEISCINIERKDEKNFNLKCDIILSRKMERSDFIHRINEMESLVAYEV